MSDSALFTLTDDHRDLQQALRQMCDEQIAPRAAKVDETGEFPADNRDLLTAAEFHAAHIPTEYDGVGADAVAVCLIIEEVARACASTSLIPAVNKLGTQPILLGSNEEARERYLPKVASGEAMFSYGLSEREAGSDTAGMKTKAVADGDEWVLNGQKSWITNAGISEFYTVLAVTDPAGKRGRNVTAFVVHADDEGFSLGEPERKLGIKGSPTREIFFENVRIGDDRRISDVDAGLKLALTTLDHTRPTIAAQAVGIAQGALDAAIAYAKERSQFGKNIAEFQGIQFMLADMAASVEAARLMTYAAASKAMTGAEDFGFFSAASKCYASDVAMKVTTDAVQIFGGAGYVSDYPVERMMRDAKITQIYEGTNQIQRMVMARHLLA